jgi:N utilization substance protein B
MSMNNRRVGRECALKILFALKLDSQADAPRLLSDFWQNFRFADDVLGEPLETADTPLPTAARLFAETLVRGVVEFRAVIDLEIREIAKNWSLERMTAVDLSILRLAAYELLYQPDIPVRVTLNEAIEIAKRYGTKESPAFINGLLDKIAQKHREPESK